MRHTSRDDYDRYIPTYILYISLARTVRENLFRSLRAGTALFTLIIFYPASSPPRSSGYWYSKPVSPFYSTSRSFPLFQLLERSTSRAQIGRSSSRLYIYIYNQHITHHFSQSPCFSRTMHLALHKITYILRKSFWLRSQPLLANIEQVHLDPEEPTSDYQIIICLVLIYLYIGSRCTCSILADHAIKNFFLRI